MNVKLFVLKCVDYVACSKYRICRKKSTESEVADMLQQQKKQICVIYCIILILAVTVFGIGDIESSRMERGLEQNKSVLREVRTTSINEIGILPIGSVLRTVFETQSLKSFQSEKTVDLWILVLPFLFTLSGFVCDTRKWWVKIGTLVHASQWYRRLEYIHKKDGKKLLTSYI